MTIRTKKLLIVLLVLTLAFVFSSCSSGGKIAGTYQLENISYVFSKDGSVRIQMGRNVFPGSFSIKKDTLNLTVGSTITTYTFEKTQEGLNLIAEGGGNALKKVADAPASVKVKASNVKTITGVYGEYSFYDDGTYDYMPDFSDLLNIDNLMGSALAGGLSFGTEFATSIIPDSGTFLIEDGIIKLKSNNQSETSYLFEKNDDSLILFITDDTGEATSGKVFTYNGEATKPSNSDNGSNSSNVNNDSNSGVLYKARTIAEMNVRSGPSTDYEKVDRLAPGTTVDVYEEVRNGEYLWRRIGADRWLADDGTWIEVLH